MSEFTDKQIEQAAQQHAAELVLPPFFTPDAEATIRDIAKSSYIYGAQDALASQWVSVEDALPEDDRYFYFVADARLDPLGVDCAEYTCETKLFSRGGKILHPTHWLAIPQLNPEKEGRL